MAKSKLSYDELQKMLDDGLRPVDIAKKMGMTESAISQRIKRMAPVVLPESFTERPPNQQHYILNRVEGLNPTQAALKSYDCTYESGKVIASRLEADPDIKIAMADLLHSEGIGRRARVKVLRKCIESNDLGIALRGIDIAAKMAGDFAPVQIETISYEQIQLLAINFSTSELLGRRDVIDIPVKSKNASETDRQY